MFIVSLWYLTYTKMLAVEALDQTKLQGYSEYLECCFKKNNQR